MQNIINEKNKRNINNQELPFVSIITVNYNGKKHLKNFFEYLNKINYPNNKYEVIFADNASIDDSVEYVINNFPEVTVIKFNKNYGFAEGNNKTIEYARGEYIALINNDTEVDKEWLMELVKSAMNHGDGIYGSTMFLDQKETIMYAGGKMAIWGKPIWSGAFQKYKEYIEYETPKLTFYADGAGMLMKKDLFLKLGGFDERYFAYSEDYDLSWRAWLYGLKVIHVPKSKYYHKIGGTLGSRSPFYVYLQWKNELRNIIKNAEILNMFKLLFFHFMYSIGAYFFIYLKEGDFLIFTQIIKAYLSIIPEIRTLLKQRKDIQKERKIKDEYFYEKGIALSFFDSLKEAKKYLNNYKKYKHK